MHAVLADRMAERDPGNKPQSNDRIPYAYIETDKEIKLQGDRVEHWDYIIKNKLKLDYLFYITNQIMKPCIQFLELIVENPEKIFREYIIKEENRKRGVLPMKYYFKKHENDENKDSFDDFADKLDEKFRMDINSMKTVKKTNRKVNTQFNKKIGKKNRNYN